MPAIRPIRALPHGTVEYAITLTATGENDDLLVNALLAVAAEAKIHASRDVVVDGELTLTVYFAAYDTRHAYRAAHAAAHAVRSLGVLTGLLLRQGPHIIEAAA